MVSDDLLELQLNYNYYEFSLVMLHCLRIVSMFSNSGFTQYLTSDECDIFDPSHKHVCEDMTLPLSHYFIASSHNTYVIL